MAESGTKVDTSAAFTEAMDMMEDSSASDTQVAAEADIDVTKDISTKPTKTNHRVEGELSKNDKDNLEELKSNLEDEESDDGDQSNEEQETTDSPLELSWAKLKQSQEELDAKMSEFSNLKAKSTQSSENNRLWKSDPVSALKNTIGAAIGTDDEELIRGHVEALHQDLTYSMVDMNDLSEDMQGSRRARQLQLELDGMKRSNEQRDKDAEDVRLSSERTEKVNQAKEFIGTEIKGTASSAEALSNIAPLLGYDPTEVVFDILTAAFDKDIEMSVSDAISRANTHFAAEEEKLREKFGMLPEKKTKRRTRRRTTSSATAGSSAGGKKKMSMKEKIEQAKSKAMKDLM